HRTPTTSLYPLSLHDALPILTSSARADPTITSCVIARDAADSLPEVLPGLRWADEVLVLIDAATTDDSPAAAAPYADRVEEHERSEEHTSELQSRSDLVCRLL